MRVQVLQVRRQNKVLVAHIQCGQLFGDVLATEDVTGPGEYELKSTVVVKDGRIVPRIRVEKQ